MKYLRPGYTESTLLFIDYALNHRGKTQKDLINHTQSEFINWLYTTSGFYDINFKGSYFDFDTLSISESDVFNRFIRDYKSSLMYADKLQFMLHKISNDQDLIRDFIQFFNPKDTLQWWNYKSWYSILQDKAILLVNSFAPLMEQQYNCGNIFKIDPAFPVLSNIFAYKTPYTFFNKGPDNNFFETLDRMKEDISGINFDIAIISCGAYAVLLSDFCNQLGKTGISIGSRMHSMWGINPAMQDNPLWISKIPDEYIPVDYSKIERGGYWK